MRSMLKKEQIPQIIINFKTYLEATGRKAVELAKKAERVSLATEVIIGVAPQFTDIASIAEAVTIPVFAQHVDPIEPGSHTGHILIDAIKDAGAIGTLLNHSEKQLKLSEMDTIIKNARENKMVSVACAKNPKESRVIAFFKPDIIAIEPPELIGTGISVSMAKPTIVTKTITLVREINAEVIILCGAGISNGEDVEAALKLGAQGVLVSSSIVKSKEKLVILCEFAKTIRNKEVQF
jgi:triosephosphate isomerase